MIFFSQFKIKLIARSGNLSLLNPNLCNFFRGSLSGGGGGE